MLPRSFVIVVEPTMFLMSPSIVTSHDDGPAHALIDGGPPMLMTWRSVAGNPCLTANFHTDGFVSAHLSTETLITASGVVVRLACSVLIETPGWLGSLPSRLTGGSKWFSISAESQVSCM